MGLSFTKIRTLQKKTKDVFESGDVITVEPGIYLQGKFGVRIEDDVLVTDAGNKILSKDTKFGFSDKDLQVISL